VYRILLAGIFLCLPSTLLAAEFQFKDGDRVVLVGSTLIEREQRYGYWELALTTRHPDKNITFRNLGWSGDTVWGESRVGFDLDNPKLGFTRLVEHVLALKPTVIIVGYGTNESFAGKEGLPRFREGMNKLLDAFAPTKARIILLSPIKAEDRGRPLPDPAEQNKRLALYRDAIHEIAKKRDNYFVDLLSLVLLKSYDWVTPDLTTGGIHATEFGYWRYSHGLEQCLGFKERVWEIKLDIKAKQTSANHAKVAHLEVDPVRFQVTYSMLPVPWPHARKFLQSRKKIYPPREKGLEVFEPMLDFRLKIKGLPPGNHILNVDGKKVTAGSAMDWGFGITGSIDPSPNAEQAEKLRKLIVEKNRLYFHRWRPENETYLFGFRKHEQGNNAVEIPKFDPLIEKLEKEIAKLRVPVAHKYELVPVK
jgi:hypothetical protein